MSDWHTLINNAMKGGGSQPGRDPRWEVQDMFAVQDTDGGIYLAGPGIWKHLSGEEWGAWERFLPPLPFAVNGVQRDWIMNDCLSAGKATWNATVKSGIDGNEYAAGDVLSSTEKQAHEAAENTSGR
jgi:hypothetical protein